MGIDAEILVRKVPRATVTDEWLKDISFRLATSIGSGKFFLSDGLLPEDAEAAYKVWSAAFDTHPSCARLKGMPFGDERTALHQQILSDIGPHPEKRRLAVNVCGSLYPEEGELPGSVYHQDGDDILAEGDECLLELSLCGRYFGIGYERGDITAYCAMAEWLEANIPGCEVWYGGDSSGVLAEPFNDAKRRELRAHLYSESGRDYFRSSFGDEGYPKPAACSLCPGNQYQGVRNGWGPSFAVYSCSGCGKSVESRDNGATWTKRTND